MKQCPICGSKFAGTESFCPHDGAHLIEAEQPAQLVGKKLHDVFKLESLLYKDAFGERYAGRVLHDGSSVKVTVFNQAFSPEESRVASLVTTKTLLDEPMPSAIATTYAWEVNASPAYVVESLPKGPSLRVLLDERGKLDWRTAVKITCSLARRLEWMDNLGVTHRMLQPEVISITHIKRGEVHLGEWALGTLCFKENPLDALEHGQLVAAAPYMAPELIDGSSKADRRSQIYALGLLLYEMLTGKAPFKSVKTEETLKRQRRERPVKLSISYEGEQLPEALDDLFEVMTAKLPEQRFQALGALVNALSSTLDDDTGPDDFPELERDSSTRPIVIKKPESSSSDEDDSGEEEVKERKQTLLFISTDEIKKAQAEASAEADDAPGVDDTTNKSTIQMDSSVLAHDIARAKDREPSKKGESTTTAQSKEETTSGKKKKKKKSKETIRLNTSDLPTSSNLVEVEDPESEVDEVEKLSTIVISKDFAEAAAQDSADSIIIDDALHAEPEKPAASKGISGSSVTEPKKTSKQDTSKDTDSSISVKDVLDAPKEDASTKKGSSKKKEQEKLVVVEEEKKKTPAAATPAKPSPTIDDDQWFSTDSEKTWDQEIFMEHEERTDKKFKTYLIIALVIFIVSMLVGGILIATAPKEDEEASLLPDSPPTTYMASLDTPSHSLRTDP